jgi:hypothetical protein
MIDTMASRQLGLAILLLTAAAGCGDQGPTTAASGSAAAAPKSAAPAAKSAAPAAPAGGGQVASCNVIKVESLCREWGPDNIEAAGADSLKTTCTGLTGEFKMEACPKDKRVGSCATPEGTKVYYTDGPLPLEAAAAEKSCKEGQPAGTWKAGS